MTKELVIVDGGVKESIDVADYRTQRNGVLVAELPDGGRVLASPSMMWYLKDSREEAAVAGGSP